MNYYTVRLIEIQLEAYKNAAALIRLPEKPTLLPGQYLHANQIGPTEEVAAVSLFLSGLKLNSKISSEDEILVWGKLPTQWSVGTQLALRGPLGKGFALPKNLQRLALASFGNGMGRLLPLVPIALAQGAEVVFFTDLEIANLPYEVELRPLNALLEAKDWADFLALECPANQVDFLPQGIGLDEDFPKKIVGEVLITKDMPCAGLAQCGICSVKFKQKEKMICESGPVFGLSEIFS